MFWPRCGPFGQFGGVRVVRRWGEGCREPRSWLEMYDVAVALGETGTLGMVREASSWSAGQVGRMEQHPAMCRAELAGPTGVLNTANSMRFARHSSAAE